MTHVSPTNGIPQLAASGTNSLRDIKPPVEIPNGWLIVWYGLGALAVAALAFLAWRYWRKRRAQLAIVPVIPPHVRAKQKLQEALALLGHPREFCILVSDTIRWYLEERFDFHAPERTTEEFLYELQSTELLTRDQKDVLNWLHRHAVDSAYVATPDRWISYLTATYTDSRSWIGHDFNTPRMAQRRRELAEAFEQGKPIPTANPVYYIPSNASPWTPPVGSELVHSNGSFSMWLHRKPPT